jgi:hypothetical protein
MTAPFRTIFVPSVFDKTSAEHGMLRTTSV